MQPTRFAFLTASLQAINKDAGLGADAAVRLLCQQLDCDGLSAVNYMLATALALPAQLTTREKEYRKGVHPTAQRQPDADDLDPPEPHNNP